MAAMQAPTPEPQPEPTKPEPTKPKPEPKVKTTAAERKAAREARLAAKAAA